MDTTSPDLAYCPTDVHKTIEAGTLQVQVSWDEPSASDKSGSVMLLHASRRSGDMFDVGSTPISYTFVDGANNSVSCGFSVIVREGM